MAPPYTLQNARSFLACQFWLVLPSPMQLTSSWVLLVQHLSTTAELAADHSATTPSEQVRSASPKLKKVASPVPAPAPASTSPTDDEQAPPAPASSPGTLELVLLHHVHASLHSRKHIVDARSTAQRSPRMACASRCLLERARSLNHRGGAPLSAWLLCVQTELQPIARQQPFDSLPC